MLSKRERDRAKLIASFDTRGNGVIHPRDLARLAEFDAAAPLMPSNPTLPEDVRDRFSEVLLEHSVDRYLDYRQGGGIVCECGETLMGALPFAEHQLDTIAPLIIEWTRKDQAEKDAQIAEFKIRNYRTIGSPGRADAACDIRAQFATPETTGGTTK